MKEAEDFAGGGRHRDVEPVLWAAIAGPSNSSSHFIPTIGSIVVYFPQGHAQHASTLPDFSSLSISSFAASSDRYLWPFFVCRIDDVKFLSDSSTDEIFAHIILQPCPSLTEAEAQSLLIADSVSRLPSHIKGLTKSDSNNGGGFSVPRLCADKVFPHLDLGEDMPAQVLSFRDLHGKLWQCRHVYRGMPQRHILTTGWSKFVNGKGLVGGDSVVFVRDQDNQLHVGIQRKARDIIDNSMIARGRLSSESVLESVNHAITSTRFEVIYYPSRWLPSFVVPLKDFIAAMKVDWVPGLQVRIFLIEESLRWANAQVTKININREIPWQYSPWQMLEVTKYEDPSHQVLNVNPWQVELISEVSIRIHEVEDDQERTVKSNLIARIRFLSRVNSSCSPSGTQRTMNIPARGSRPSLSNCSRVSSCSSSGTQQTMNIPASSQRLILGNCSRVSSCSPSVTQRPMNIPASSLLPFLSNCSRDSPCSPSDTQRTMNIPANSSQPTSSICRRELVDPSSNNYIHDSNTLQNSDLVPQDEKSTDRASKLDASSARAENQINDQNSEHPDNIISVANGQKQRISFKLFGKMIETNITIDQFEK